MGIEDKAEFTEQNHLGAAKEGAGNLTSDRGLEREREKDQAAAGMKEAGERAKDAAADVGENIKDAAADIGENIKNAARKLKNGFRCSGLGGP